MSKFILCLGLLVCACGGSDDAIDCAKTDRTGTYVGHFSERANGTCGAIPDTVLRFDGSSDALPAGCAFDAPDVWSADQCKLDRSYTCPVEGTANTVSVVGTSLQTTDDGSKIEGVETVTGYDGRGAFLCTSTYDFTATRQ